MIKLNLRRVIADAIERGLQLGFQRAHKHTDTPPEDHILEQQQAAIWLELDEMLEFRGFGSED